MPWTFCNITDIEVFYCEAFLESARLIILGHPYGVGWSLLPIRRARSGFVPERKESDVIVWYMREEHVWTIEGRVVYQCVWLGSDLLSWALSQNLGIANIDPIFQITPSQPSIVSCSSTDEFYFVGFVQRIHVWGITRLVSHQAYVHALRTLSCGNIATHCVLFAVSALHTCPRWSQHTWQDIAMQAGPSKPSTHLPFRITRGSE